MRGFVPSKIFYEKDSLKYYTGKMIYDKYSKLDIPFVEIDNHNNIPEFKELPDEEYLNLKKYLILGIRKSIKLTPNNCSADYIIPFTSSGCSAMCLYCYLMCTFFKCSYLRIFVNREEIIQKLKKKDADLYKKTLIEIGSNSDMILENTITNNLNWAIEEFGRMDYCVATLATKFSMVEPLLNLKHNGKTQIRISVNPEHIINKVEIGTSPLKDRVEAANKLYKAGYRIGINVAPVILFERWEEYYSEMFKYLYDNLDINMQKSLFFEIIFMTYGYANDIINKAALPKAIDIFEKDIMKPKGRGKYTYKDEYKEYASKHIVDLIYKYFPTASISYIV